MRTKTTFQKKKKNYFSIIGVAYQKLGHVKSQILDKTEAMLCQWSHMTNMTREVVWGLGAVVPNGAQSDEHYLTAVMS